MNLNLYDHRIDQEHREQTHAGTIDSRLDSGATLSTHAADPRVRW